MLSILLLSCSTTEPIPSARAERGDLDVHLEFKGEFKAKNSVEITNPLAGWSEIEFIIDDGASVKQGDEVLRFTTEELSKELVEARAKLEVARTKVEQARARLQIALGNARATIVQAELDAELARFRQTDSLTVPRVERERSIIEAQLAEITTKSADTKLSKIELEARANIQLLELEAVLAEQKIERLEEKLARATVVAPSDGVVMVEKRWGTEPYRVGHDVYQGSTVIRLPEVSALDVTAWIHEVDSPGVHVGQEAMVTMDAHPDTHVPAVIREVAPVVVPRGEFKIMQLKVKLDLSTTTETMKPGMTVELDLVTERVEDVVLVPTEAVFKGAQGAVVYRNGWSAEPIAVAVLAEHDGMVAVEGIEEGDEVYTFDPVAWERGERPAEDAE